MYLSIEEIIKAVKETHILNCLSGILEGSGETIIQRHFLAAAISGGQPFYLPILLQCLCELSNNNFFSMDVSSMCETNFAK